MVFLVGEEGEAFVVPFVASATFVVLHLSKQTYLLAKEGNCGKQILRLVSSSRGDIFPLPCSYFVTCALFVICRPEYPPYQARDSGPRVSAAHLYSVISAYLLHIHIGPHLYFKFLTFHIC